MPSKTSFFNFTVFKKTLLQNFPLWVVYWIGLILFLPLNLLSETNIRFLYQSLFTTVIFFAGLGAIAAAIVSFNYLNKTRSCYMIHSFPLTRLTLYVSNGFAGLAMLLVPFLLTYWLSAAKLPLPASSLFFFSLFALAIYLFFYALAVFSMIVTANSVAAVFLYTFLNIGVVCVEELIRTVVEPLLYGVSWKAPVSSPFSPAIHLLDLADELPSFGRVTPYCIVLAALSLILFFISFLLYKQRHAEAAGEIVAHAPSRPIFKYLVTVFASLALGEFFCLIVFFEVDSYRNFLPVCAMLLLAAFLGFFGAEMLLRKSLKVFNGKNILAFVLYSVLLVGALGILRADLTGFVSRVPKTEEIVSAELSLSNGPQVPIRIESPEDFGRLCALHEKLIDERDESGLDYRYGALSVDYTLASGKHLYRNYPLFESGAADNALDALLNNPKITEEWICEIFEKSDLMTLEYWAGEDSYSLPGTYDTVSEAYWVTHDLTAREKDELKEALLKDISEGTFEIRRYGYIEGHEIMLYRKESDDSSLYLGLLSIPENCSTAIACLNRIQ